MSLIFQDPSTALNPVLTIGDQLTEVIRRHLTVGRNEARERALALLRSVEIPDPAGILRAYPHQLSGGMKQRAVIALAVGCGPQVIVADEPTTALDVTIQEQVLHLLRRLAKETGAGIVLITHNFGVVAEIGDTVAVMYAGKIVERGAAADVVRHPRHPYTEALLASVPRLRTPRGHRLVTIAGQPPSSQERIDGCPFHPRCPLARSHCATSEPPLVPVGQDRWVACWERTAAQQAVST